MTTKFHVSGVIADDINDKINVAYDRTVKRSTS